MTARALADLLLSRIFAPPCAACGHVLDRPLAGAMCDRCWAAVVRFTPPVCRGCGDPQPSWRQDTILAGLCPRCRRWRRPISWQAAVGPYDGTLREAVHALKYGGRRSVAPRLAALMRDAGASLLRGVDLVVPVPLHAHREWTRGFNQAEVLAAGLGPPVGRLLRRVRATPPQVDLPAAERHGNVRGAFTLHSRAVARATGRTRTTLDGLVLALVDDVATTGATLDACASVLADAGAADVRALTVARVSTGPRA